MRWKIISAHAHKNISCSTRYSIVQKLINKQSAKYLATALPMHVSYVCFDDLSSVCINFVNITYTIAIRFMRV